MSANQDSLMSARANLILATARPLAGAVLLGLTLSPALSISAAIAAPIVGVPAALPVNSQNSLLQPVAVFGRDTRRPVPQSLAPLAAKIGVLHDPRSHSVCTTFCVAPDIVATAAHCLYRTGDEPAVRLSDVTVRLHGARATSRVASMDTRAAAPNVLAGSTRLNVQPPIDAPRDWALLRLAQPLCKGGSLPLSRRSVADVMRLARAGRVYNIAYHRDLPKWQPMLARPCRVRRSFTDAAWSTIRKDFSDPDQLLLHTCDTGAASSGSPLLVDGPHGPEVVGINVGTYVQSKVIMLNGKVVHRFKSDDIANTGVNSLAFAAALDAFIGADMLAGRRDIRRLQEALAARALYEGPRDGRFSPALKTAIEIFERASGMPVTGLATRALLATLLGESQVVTGKVAKPRESAAAPLRR